jgi:two-component system nitrogen regulation sensor histidine kinase NtrY
VISPVAGPNGGAVPIEPAERRRRRREGFLIIAAGLAVVIFALWELRRPGATDAAAGNVFSFFVVNVNIILLLLLIFLVLRNVLKLVLERRRRVSGSHLRARLVLAFTTIALFPAAVMLLISLEFSTNAIDDWFNNTVEESLIGASELAQTYYRTTADHASLHARRLAHELARDGSDAPLSSPVVAALVERYQRDFNLGTVQIFEPGGKEIATVASRHLGTGPRRVADAELLAKAVSGDEALRVEAFGASDLVRAAAPVRDESGTPVAVLVVDTVVPESAHAWSERALAAYHDYRKLKLNKQPFKNLYVLTMALASLVVVFSATWLGLYLARSITEPLARVSDATRKVAEGQWDVQLSEEGGDEIGTLVRSFKSMTADLQASHATLEERRRYIENILAHIDAGVVAVDEEGKVSAVNAGAVSLLGIAADRATGQNASALFSGAGYPEVTELLDALAGGVVASGTRRSVTRESEGRTFMVTATSLVGSRGERHGSVLFFEDVSRIVSAQRVEVWREVARRIAHEIKNPLTPIQLSAQRMQRKLAGRLSGDDRAVLEESTNTIVSEVDELKRLVNEFAQFAQRSPVEKRPQDLNQLVEETLPLFSNARPEIAMRFEPDAALPRVDLNRDAVKRALVNLLDNAVAAVSGEIKGPARADAPREIVVRTRYDADLDRACLEVADTGPGVAVDVRARLFEPYFSTRAGGTGLGLAIVAAIAADHRAFVRHRENTPCGSRFVIEFPATSIGSA